MVKINIMAKKINMEERARISQGLSYRCSACKFRFQMLDDELGVCKICTNTYIEAYKKGYRQAKRDNKQK